MTLFEEKKGRRKLRRVQRKYEEMAGTNVYKERCL